MKAGLILCFFTLVQLSFAQDGEMKWGNVTVADLLAKRYEKDTSAEAVVLGDYGLISVYNEGGGVGYYFKQHRQLKIFKKTAIEQYGDVSIPYYHHEDSEQLTAIKAQVHTPSGKIYALERKDFFYEKVNEYWTMLKFSLPMLEEGAILEYQYEITSKLVAEPRTWYFQEETGALQTSFGEYRIEVTQVESQLRCNRYLKVDPVELPAEKYEEFRDFWRDVAKLDAMKIVLVEKKT